MSNASRPTSSAKRPTSASANAGRKFVSNPQKPLSLEKPPSGKTKNIAQGLLSKEEEYMLVRLNAELEERTANLIKEAEEVMLDQDELLARPATTELEVTEDLDDMLPSMDISQFTNKPASNLANKQRPSTGLEGELIRPHSSSAGKQGTRPGSRTKKTRPKSKTTSAPGSVRHTPVPSDPMMDMLHDRITLANTISALEDDCQDGSYRTTIDSSVLPVGAEEMGSEATIRFLKAKLRVLQEELDRVVAECNKKDEKSTEVEKKVKELTDEQGRLQKTNQGLQSQIDKYKKLYDECKHKNEGLEQQLVALRKDLDSIQRDQKQAASNKNVTEVRLNRALEEAEKYKTALKKAKSESKDTGEQDRKRIEQLLAENKRLEKQKNELMAGFKKQMKLIDVLKRQKMHIEAAKLLQFSEEEFVKALDWGS
ncbi:testis-expressed protein 9-like isoform X3 [Montipora capricornis]|uniref:testis-expressed protein 9-like isoform X3 n=1 Tax=Montipora capricornis TaxID=246305 RepID=UPI0035F1ADA4